MKRRWWAICVGLGVVSAACPTEIRIDVPRKPYVVVPGPDADPNDPPPPPPPPPPPCVDDDSEDNDDRASAAVLSVAMPTAARVCGSDDDWFSVAVGDGCVLQAVLEIDAADHDRGDDVDVVVTNAAGELLASAQGLAQRDALRVVAQSAEPLLLRVRGSSSSDCGYTLSATVSCGASCPADDGFEPNDDAATSTTTDEGVIIDGAACGANADFFTVPVRNGCVADVQIRFVDGASASDDLDLILQTASGVELLKSASSDDDERLLIGSTEPVIAKVFVFNGTGTAGNDYAFRVDARCAGDFACPSDDIFEPNDDATFAQKLVIPGRVPARICGQNADFFSLSAPAGCTTVVDVMFQHASGDLDIKLLTPAGIELASSASTDDDEQVVLMAGTTALLQVVGYNDGENGYDVVTHCQ